MLIIVCDGIGTAKLADDDERSILGAVARRLAESLRHHKFRADIVRADWPASMAGVGGPMSWANAAHLGVMSIDHLLRTNPSEQAVLVGYSGGCRVVHDWVDTRHQDRHRIAAVGLLSDPYRPASRWQHRVADPDGWGICGQRVGHLPHDTLWSSHPDDVISSCPPDSPLRTLADLSDRIPGGFLDDFIGHMRLGDWQLATYMGMWRRDPIGYLNNLVPRMRAARRGVDGYLRGSHTKAYTRPFDSHDGDMRPLTDRLADSLSWKVRNP
ncbi:MAG: hypothetical protein U1C73_03395 [Dietzia sp.]|nr:hypothetical protein [Dietzia sp.]